MFFTFFRIENFRIFAISQLYSIHTTKIRQEKVKVWLLLNVRNFKLLWGDDAAVHNKAWKTLVSSLEFFLFFTTIVIIIIQYYFCIYHYCYYYYLIITIFYISRSKLRMDSLLHLLCPGHPRERNDRSVVILASEIYLQSNISEFPSLEKIFIQTRKYYIT